MDGRCAASPLRRQSQMQIIMTHILCGSWAFVALPNPTPTHTCQSGTTIRASRACASTWRQHKIINFASANRSVRVYKSERNPRKSIKYTIYATTTRTKKNNPGCLLRRVRPAGLVALFAWKSAYCVMWCTHVVGWSNLIPFNGDGGDRPAVLSGTHKTVPRGGGGCSVEFGAARMTQQWRRRRRRRLPFAVYHCDACSDYGVSVILISFNAGHNGARRLRLGLVRRLVKSPNNNAGKIWNGLSAGDRWPVVGVGRRGPKYDRNVCKFLGRIVCH